MRAERRAPGRWATGAAALAMLLFAPGCAHDVVLKTEPAGLHVVLDDEDLGPAPADGLPAEVPIGPRPQSWRLLDDDGNEVGRGTLAQTRLNRALASASASAPLVCVPAFFTVALCALNPAICAPVPVGLFALSPAACAAHLSQTVAFASVPVATGCASAGLFPLAGLLFAGAPPSTVVLRADAGAAHPDAAPHRVRAMEF